MNSISVSIIIPLYNVEEYILECLQSVACQTYEGYIECIVVDDCGCDNSLAEVEKFISDYIGRIRFLLLHHNINRGLSEARNTGIKGSTGDYIYFLDSDDYILPDCIDSMVQMLHLYPQTDMVLSEYSKLQDGNLESQSLNPSLSYIDKENVSSVDFYKDNNIMVYAWNKLVKRSWIEENLLFFEKDRLSEDVLWTYKTLIVKPSVAYNHKPTYIYRVRNNSITTNLIDKGKFLVFLDSQILNYVDMATAYLRCNAESLPLLQYLLWFRFDVLKQASNRKCGFKNIYHLCKVANTAKALPMKKVSWKHAVLDVCIRKFSRLLSLFLSCLQFK